MKTGLIITAYTNTDEKVKVLYNLVKKLKESDETKDFYLVLASHQPINLEIQKYCDYSFYEAENQVDSRKYSHGAAESNLILSAFQVLDSQNITHTYKLTFDMILDDLSIFENWKSKNTKLVVAKWFTWGIGLFAFYTEIKFFKKYFHLFKTIDEMFEYSEKNKLTFSDGTVLIEKILVDDLMKSDQLFENSIYIYFDSVEMLGNNHYCNLYHSDEIYEKLQN